MTNILPRDLPAASSVGADDALIIDDGTSVKRATAAQIGAAAGVAATVTIGTVTTGAPGDPAVVVNSGTDTDAVLDFTLPAGPEGPTGDTDVATLSSNHYLIGRTVAPIAGTDTGSGTYLFPDTLSATTAKLMLIRTGSAGGIVRIVKGTLVGTTWTRTGFVDTASLAANSTLNVAITLALAAGEVLGVSVGAGTLSYTNPGIADGSGWRSLGANASSGTASALQTGSRLEVGFRDFPQTVTSTTFAALQATAGNRKVERMPWSVNFLSGDGQSNMSGASGGSVSSTQEYDNQTFLAQSASSTAEPLPMTLANTQQGASGETPIIGACGYLKQRLLEENELAYTDMTWQLIGCNDGFSGAGIVSLSKAGASGMYSAWLTQLTAVSAYASARSLPWGYLGWIWAQGESDFALTQAQYLAYLLQYELDKRTDAIAASGQHIAPVGATWQLASGNRQISMAQRQAAQLCPNIICVGPAYPFTYVDTFHVNPTSSKVLGGYFGKAQKQTAIDGIKFQPLDYDSYAVFGNTIKFFMNRTGLKIDTTGAVPDQSVASTNKYGFSALNASNAAQTVNSVTITDNVVAVTFAATPAAGWVVSYAAGFVGYTWTVGNGGGSGNLRDCAGDTFVYQGVPMHNWCLAFDVTL